VSGAPIKRSVSPRTTTGSDVTRTATFISLDIKGGVPDIPRRDMDADVPVPDLNARARDTQRYDAPRLTAEATVTTLWRRQNVTLEPPAHLARNTF
jgi:hypothetical protein